MHQGAAEERGRTLWTPFSIYKPTLSPERSSLVCYRLHRETEACCPGFRVSLA